MFSWLRRQRPQWDPAWEDWLLEGVWQFKYLAEDQKERARSSVAKLVHEKHWSGGSGFEVTRQMQVVISGVASLITVGLDDPFEFPGLRSIILYPSTYQEPDADAVEGLLIGGDAIASTGPRWGEAWPHGPIVLSWRHAQRQARVRGKGNNVVLHEFAHYLDGLDGHMDGTPTFEARELRQKWRHISDSEYHRLLGQAWRNEASLLNHYGAANPAEFLAVAIECFFEQPQEMADKHSELYELFTFYFRQDPGEWIPHSPRKERITGLRQSSARERDMESVGLSGHDASFAKAVLLMNEQQYEEACAIFSELLLHDPSDQEALLHRAQARYALEKYRESAEDSQRVLDLEEDNIEALIWLSATSIELGDDRQASKLVRQVLSQERANPEGLALKGRLAARAGELEEAIDCLQRAVRGVPYDSEVRFWLSLCLDKSGAREDAQFHRERALQLDPSLADRPSYP